MADISVTLVLDDAQYVGKLASATAKTEDFGKKAKTATEHAGKGFEDLAGKAEQVKGKMESLTAVLLGAGFAEVAHRALDLADTIVDLSKGSDISISKILQLREAFEANGGSAEGLGKVIQKLNNYLQEARDGSSQAQEALLKLGLSFKDMASMDTEGAMKTIIKNLANQEDAITRNAMAVKIFGKEAKNIDWNGIKEGTKTSTEEYDKYAEGLRQAAEAHDKLIAAGEKLLVAMTNLLTKSGVLGWINSMNQDMSKFERIVTIAGEAMVLYFGARGVILLVEFASALNKVALATEGVMVAMKLLENGTVVGRIASIVVTLGLAAAAMFGLKVATDAAISGGGESKSPLEQFTEKLGKLPEKWKTLYNSLEQEQKNAVMKLSNGGVELQEAIQKVAGKTPSGKTNTVPDEVKRGWADQIAALDTISEAYKSVVENQLKKYTVDTETIGMSKQQADSMKLLAEFTAKYKDELAKLDQKQKEISAGAKGGNKQETDDKLAQVAKEKQEITEIYNIKKKEYELDIANRTRAEDAEKKRVMVLEDEIALRNRINDINNQGALLGLGKIAQGYAQIEQNAKKAAQAEIDAKNKELGTSGQLSKEQEKEYFERHAKLAESEKKALQSYNDSARAFQTGWKTAFENYIDEATNAATRAEAIFNSMTSNMNSAIDKFVDTGKFSFGDFANSVIRDIIKIQMKANVANIIGGVNSSGGLINMISGLFRAEGGSVKSGQPYIVGEKGPEMFVPNSGGNIIPNKMLGSGQNTPAVGAPTINYNISAVDANSFKVMLAQDPNFLYAVTEQGRKSLPQTRR